jgi:hypothetical protein
MHVNESGLVGEARVPLSAPLQATFNRLLRGSAPLGQVKPVATDLSYSILDGLLDTTG